MHKKIKLYIRLKCRCIKETFPFEGVGLLILLGSFGWQYFETDVSLIVNEAHFYEINEKLDNVITIIYDEATHSDRYKGQGAIEIDYDTLYKKNRHWILIKENLEYAENQVYIFGCIRVSLYVLGSVFVLLPKFGFTKK